MLTISDPSSAITTSIYSTNVTAFVKLLEAFLYSKTIIKDYFSFFLGTFGYVFRASFTAISSAFTWAFNSLSTWRYTAFSWVSNSFLYLFSAACAFLAAFSAFSTVTKASFATIYTSVSCTLVAGNN